MQDNDHKKYPTHNLLDSLELVTTKISGGEEIFPELKPEFMQVQESIKRLKEKIELTNSKAIEDLNRHFDDKRQENKY